MRILFACLLFACAGAPTEPVADNTTVQVSYAGDTTATASEEPVRDHGKPHSHGAMPHRFEHADDWVARFEGPERDAWQKPPSVIAAAGIAKGQAVADLGTGTGYMVPHISKAVGDSGRVLALDVEPDMIRYVNERSAREQLGNVSARVIKADDPGLESASLDRILIVDTWHHIADREAYASKLAFGLRGNGAVVVVDFTMDSPVGPPPDHRISPEQVIRELASAGLQAKVVAEELPNQFVVVATKPATAKK